MRTTARACVTTLLMMSLAVGPGAAAAQAGPKKPPPPTNVVVVNTANHDAQGWSLEGYEIGFSKVDGSDFPNYVMPQPPMGQGALRYRVTSGGQARARFRNLDGMAVAQLTQLEYSTMLAVSTPGPHLVLEVDTKPHDSIARADHTLVSLPRVQPEREWVNWNAMTGTWLLYTGTEEATGRQPRQVTLSQYTLENPTATLAERPLDPGSLSLDVGETPGQVHCATCVHTAEASDAYADVLTIQLSNQTLRTYDFEP